MSYSLRPNGLLYIRLLSHLLTPRVCSKSCPLSQWCYPTISSSVIPFSSRLQSFPALGSFSMIWLFASGGQSIGASTSASVFLTNIQGLFPSKLTGFISLQSKGFSRVLSSTTIWKHLFFNVHPPLWSNSRKPSELVNLVIILSFPGIKKIFPLN